ncbi:16S rRNA (cytosine(1402)-N(4))-methyltransferase RsmH [Natranaerofaba carboxydovora]|uniref:16S rRNA (cytosine(1402)-N(4))-methyltransferase RsmH n=1 Tax=Natranaerofaba carboxydovora TaxID=2742683 RepID=UPI001F13BEDA|nr:16S rRNA (cytosine(1402)-N(4))-methyltransferase RsmH [Natranaerofaba carboxydovora]UMZ73250.1 Ribosomal RNA small subunit methyltransferase H [Natranaerofaba carboxydovora]
MGYHKGVLVEEVIKKLEPKPDKIILDGTVGGATHAKEIAKHISPSGFLIALDKDERAIKEAKKVLNDSECKIKLIKADFVEIDKTCNQLGVEGLDGILLDLGVSSYQLDQGERGFSYQHDGPLDMRMDREQQYSAKDAVNELSAQELANIIWKYGEERWSKRIAEKIVENRKGKRIEKTSELTQIIKKAIPAKARQKGPHPAKRTFQALRIYVNQEIEKIETVLDKGVKLLNPGGRFVVISFHSLEDRVVKNKFKEFEKNCFCPPKIPKCICGATPLGKVLTRKPVQPTKEELEINHRARSSKLRAFLKEGSKQ